MRVALIQMPTARAARSHRTAPDDAYPIGIAYLHAAATRAGHEVRSFDFSHEGEDGACAHLEEVIASWRPRAVGFDVLTSNRKITIRAAQLVHRLAPNVLIILGGAHATELPEQMIEQIPSAYVLRGECDESFPDLLSHLADGREPSDIEGLVWLAPDGVRNGPAPRPVLDLDTLPRMAHHAFLGPESRWASVITGRGCPFTCSFCAVARRKMRWRSVSAVVDEIESLTEQFPKLELVRFWDDQMFFDNRRVILLCEELVRRRIRLHYTALGRIRPCSAELVAAMEEAGFLEVLFGLETGSSTVAELCDKKIRPDDMSATLELFQGSPIRVFTFLITGLRGETWESVAETAKFVQSLQRIKYMPLGDFVGIATVYPGTDLYRRMLEAGKMDDRFWISSDFTPLFTLEHSEETLFEMQRWLLARVDPYQLFHSSEAIDFQRGHLLDLAAYVAENWQRPDSPHCTREWLRPFMGMIIEALRNLEDSGALRVSLGSGASKTLESGDPLFRMTFRRKGGGVYELEREQIPADMLILEVIRYAATRSDRALSTAVENGLESALRARLGGRDNARAAQ
jgi:anaerobic magnesium-protoporphyrin IX monomethyl ester cyclase